MQSNVGLALFLYPLNKLTQLCTEMWLSIQNRSELWCVYTVCFHRSLLDKEEHPMPQKLSDFLKIVGDDPITCRQMFNC